MARSRLLWMFRACAAALAVLALPAIAAAQFVIGPAQGSAAGVQLIEPAGTRTVDPFPGFTGGVSLTLGDVNGDGIVDIITGAGPGGGPHVQVFSGTDLSLIASFFAFHPAFAGGVHVAAGDVDGDGHADIIVGAGAGGGPHVRVFSGSNLSELASFFAYHPAFGGGVFVAAGDVDGDGRADIVTGAGPGAGPHVRVLRGTDLSELASFFAYDPGFAGGVSVAAGDLNGDGLSDVITGAGPGAGPHVRAFSGLNFSELASFWAFDPAFGGGVGVATGDVDEDGRVDLILGAGPGAGSHVRILSGTDLHELAGFFADVGGSGVSVGSTGDLAGVRFTSPDTTTFQVGTPGTFTITTAGTPTPAITSSGTLPSGVTLTDNGDGTATLAGTPGAGSGGAYALTFTADNGGPTTATQNVTLTVRQPPAITSAAATTFPIGAPGTFTVTTTGFPRPAITRTGAALPAGVTFVDNGNGTGTLSGTPAAGTGGSYALTFTATNGAGAPAVQTFTLTVNGAPAITSANATTFTVGSPGTFTVTTVGSPTAAIGVSGALPAGVSFVDNGNGTGTLSGTPAAGTGGVRSLTFTASNGVAPNGSQAFTLTVNQAPAITSAAATGFTVGTPGSFTVTTTGFPVPTIVRSGAALPTGVTFVDNGNGTGTLSGTPAAGTNGTYALTFTATGSGPAAVQSFTLTVSAGPTITSASSTTFTVGSAGTFTVTTTGSPTPAISFSGALPGGVTFLDNGNGTGTLSGTPGAGTGGSYPITFTATNGVLPNGTQSFTLTVRQAPVITSAASATFTIGAAGSFTVTTSGFPAPSLARGGVSLPSGLTFVDNGNGTGTLSGTPGAGTGGTYAITFTATNTVGATAPQAFTLTVNQPPAITSANATTFTVGSAGSFTVTTVATPTAAISVSGALPGGVTFLDNGNGTGTLSGTPGAGTGGSYSITFTAANGVLPNGTQSFTLNVNQAPAITSAASTTFTVGAAGSFTVTTSGFPAPSLARGGVALPSGLTFVDNGNGTGTLSGTPGAGTGGTYAITFTATNTVGATAPQAFTLTVNQPPAITSANSTTFTVGSAGTFTVTTTGFPAPTIARGGVALPGGLTFVDNANGTGTLAGTPAAGTAGSYAITFTATNTAGSSPVQSFTLTVHQPPAITSAASTTFTVGTPGTFTVTTTGFPTPTVSQTGTLPTGVTFTPATRVLGGTATQTGAFPLVFAATNSVPPDATQNFTLNVVCPAITVTPLVMPDGLFQTAYPGVDFNQTGSTGSSFTWGATGLPAGLTINSTSGVVSGTATNTVLSNAVVITVTDNFGCPGTLNTAVTIRPTTDNESYTGGVGHTQYATGAPFPTTPHVAFVDNVKTGDNGPGALTVTFPATSTNGSIVEGTTDGTFIYTPNLNFGGPSDSFTYTLTDGNGVTNTGTVTINLSNIVWYVNSSGGAGDGRSHSPFNTLNAAATPSGSTHIIYVHSGGATTTGNLAMDANQTLHGQGAAFTLNGLTIPAGTRPTLTGTVTLADNTTVRAVNFTPSGIAAMAASAVSFAQPVTIDQVNVTGGTSALSLTNVTATATGAINVSNANFLDTSLAEVLISQGNIPVTLAGTATITSNAGRSVDIQNRTGGTVTFNSPITDTGSGIFLNVNTGSTINFTGGLSLTTGANPGFTATGGGTVSVTGTNTITTTTGTALNVASTTIGPSGLTFRSISANGAANGIILNSTGAGGFTVTGNSSGLCGGAVGSGPPASPASTTAPNTADCTGGTIQGSTGAGIVLTNASNVSLTRLRVINSGNDGLQGTNVTGFTMTACLFDGNGNAINESGLDFGDTTSITPNGLHGTGSITSSAILNSYYNGVSIRNFDGAALTSFNVTGSQFRANPANGEANDNLFFEASGSASITASVSGSHFSSTEGDHFQAAGVNSGTLTLNFVNNTLTGGHSTPLGQGITINAATGVAFGGYTGTVNYNIDGNSINGAISNAIIVNLGTSGAAGLFNGFIRNNVIGTTGVTESGSTQASGITIDAHGNGTHTSSVTGNTIREAFDRAINVLANDGGGVLNLTVQSNNLGVSSNPLGSRESFFLNNASTTTNVFGEVDHHTVRLNLGGAGGLANVLTHGIGAPDDFRVRQRFDSRIEMPGYAGTPFDTAAVVAYLQGRNTGSAGEPGSVTANDSATVTTDGFFSGTVPTPTPF